MCAFERDLSISFIIYSYLASRLNCIIVPKVLPARVLSVFMLYSRRLWKDLILREKGLVVLAVTVGICSFSIWENCSFTKIFIIFKKWHSLDGNVVISLPNRKNEYIFFLKNLLLQLMICRSLITLLVADEAVVGSEGPRPYSPNYRYIPFNDNWKFICKYYFIRSWIIIKAL